MLGQQIDGHERVLFDGRHVGLRSGHAAQRHLAYYKPVGEVTTARDPEGRQTVFDALPRLKQGRWISVGRLDINTSGLLILTTDGELAHRLMHPSYRVSRFYSARVLGELSRDQIQALQAGVQLEDGQASFETIARAGGTGANRWYRVGLREGRNREVRRMFEAVGVTVSRLIRVEYGPVGLGKLSRGRYRHLGDVEVANLYSAVGLAVSGNDA